MGERQLDHFGAEAEPDAIGLDAEQLPLETAAAVDGGGELELRLVALEALIVLASDERPVNAWRAHLEHIGVLYRIRDVEQRRDRMGDLRAVLDAHRPVVDPLRHDLQHLCAPSAGHGDTHEPIAHRFERRRDQRLDAGGVDHQMMPRGSCLGL